MNGSYQQHKTSPCGACRFLRRKCVKEACVFAPYFHSDEGMAHFAAVHKVFGASNASKMLMAVPKHRRPEVVLALCYEAVARVTDPVYGCVAHIFNLQQQVVNLQAELAFIQAKLSILQSLPQQGTPNSATDFQSSSDLTSICISPHFEPSTSSDMAPHFEPSTSSDMASLCSLLDDKLNKNSDLRGIGYEFLSKYFPE